MFGKKKRLRFIAENRVSSEREKYLGLGAAMICLNSPLPLVLATRGNPKYRIMMLERGWGVVDAASANETIIWLLQTGHRAEGQAKYSAMKAGQPVAINSAYPALLEEAPRYGFTEKEIRACDNIAAWDYDRAAGVARLAHSVGYVSEEAVWHLLTQIAPQVKAEFPDWRSYGISTVVGRSFCYGGDPADWLFGLEALLQNDLDVSPWALHPLSTL